MTRMVQQACEKVLNILSQIPGIDSEAKDDLTKKVKAIAAQAIDPKSAEVVEQKFSIEDLSELPPGEAQHILIGKIVREVLLDSSDEAAQKVTDAVSENIKQGPDTLNAHKNSSSRHVHFQDESDPVKEGGAKGYERKKKNQNATTMDHLAKEQKQHRKSQGVSSDINTFTHLKSLYFARIQNQPSEEITDEILTQTFGQELETQFSYRSKDVESAISFFSDNFAIAVQRTVEEIQEKPLGQDELLDNFYKHFRTLNKDRQSTEIVDKEDFAALAQPYLKSKNPKSPPEYLKPFIDEFQSGRWKEGQKKQIPAVKITEQAYKNAIGPVVAILQYPAFVEVMGSYFMRHSQSH